MTLALQATETTQAGREAQMRQHYAQAAIDARIERGYQILGLYTIKFHAERAASRIPIGDRIGEIVRDLDAVLRAHNMRLADVLPLEHADTTSATK